MFFKGPKFVIIFLVGILIIPCLLLIENIESPGPNVDDSRIIVISNQFIKNDEKLVEKRSYETNLKIFDKVFPLGVFYNGLPQLYIINAPVVYLLGPTLITIRIIGIILFVLTTIFTYLMSKELFNQKIGLVSASLFAFTPVVFLIAKYPSYGTAMLSFFLVVSFYFLIKWKNTKKLSYMAAAFLIFGLGFDIKILFIWPVIALVFAFLIFRPRLDVSLKNIAIMIICSITGAILFFIRWAENFKIYSTQVAQYSEIPRNSGSNTDIISNFMLRIEHVFTLVDGSIVSRSFGGDFSNESFSVFFFLSVAGIILMWIFKRSQYSRRAIFLVFIFFVILLLSIFTLTSRDVTSLFFLTPIITIIIAAFLVTSTENMLNLKNGKMISSFVIYGILIFLIMGNIVVINDYKDEVKKTGGRPYWSTHILEAGRFLLEQNYSKATTLDTAHFATMYVASEGKVDFTGITTKGDNKNEKFVEQYQTTLIKALKDPEMVFVKFNDNYNNEKRKTWDIINDVLDEENKKFITIRAFNDWKGQNHTTIFKAVNLE